MNTGAAPTNPPTNYTHYAAYSVAAAITGWSVTVVYLFGHIWGGRLKGVRCTKAFLALFLVSKPKTYVTVTHHHRRVCRRAGLAPDGARFCGYF